jgi:hypothetical protein
MRLIHAISNVSILQYIQIHVSKYNTEIISQNKKDDYVVLELTVTVVQ